MSDPSIMARWQFLSRFFDERCSIQLFWKGDRLAIHLLNDSLPDTRSPYPGKR